jgi:hypothetical protein
MLAVLALAACSSDHDPGEFGQRGATTTTTTSVLSSSVPTSSAASSATADSTTTTAAGATTTTLAGATTTAAAAAGTVRGTAVAGAAGAVEPGGPPYAQTDPFSEAVRLADGTCVGWADSRGGSTVGLALGSTVAVLDPTTSALLGSGTITGSRWADPSGGGNQWTCFFDFSADVANAPAEVLVKVGELQPWTARPDPADPARKVASVSTDASIGQIASCPALPTPTTTGPPAATAEPTTTAAPTSTVAAGPPVTGWNAIGQYWSVGIDSLCKAGLPVTALARPCRQPNQGSEYITAVVDSNHSTVRYANAAAIPAGTPLTVVVATGRPCD